MNSNSRKSFIYLLLLLSLDCFGQANIKFDTDTIKVDTVYFNEPDTTLKNVLRKKVNLGKVKYIFQNTGNELLIIQMIIDNGVAYSTFTKDLIKPGGGGFIECEFFDDNYIDGKFTKCVTVDGNFIGQDKTICLKGYKKRKLQQK